MSEVLVTHKDPVLEHHLKGHKKQIFGISFHPRTAQIASCSSDNTIMLWNLLSKNIRCYAFKGHTDVVTSINFSSDGQFMVSSSQDRTIRLWIPTITGGSTDFRAHTAAVRTVCFSPSNQQLLSGSNDKSLKLWNVQDRRFLASFLGHTNWIRSAKFSPDGQIIASCSDDKSLRIWDTSSTQMIHTFHLGKGTGTCVDFHHNGNSVALATSTGSVRVYDIRNNKLQQHYILHDNTTCVAWHPCANYLLTSGVDGTLKVVDVLEGRPLYTLHGHDGGINTVNFNQSGDLFASGGIDCHILVWRTKFVHLESFPDSTSFYQESIV